MAELASAEPAVEVWLRPEYVAVARNTGRFREAELLHRNDGGWRQGPVCLGGGIGDGARKRRLTAVQ